MTNKSDVSYQFGIVESYSQQYALDLKDRSENALADWVKNDPDYKNMPDQFTDTNRILFFRFFDKYGIYYMPRVVVGSRMFYSSMVKKEYKYSAADAEAKLFIRIAGLEKNKLEKLMRTLVNLPTAGIESQRNGTISYNACSRLGDTLEQMPRSRDDTNDSLRLDQSVAFEGHMHGGPVLLSEVIRRDPELIRANVAELPVHHVVIDKLQQ